MPQVSAPNYYDDGDAPDSAPASGGADGAHGKTAMLNKDVLCGDVSVGSQFTIRVVADHGGEVEVECVSGGSEKAGSGASDEGSEQAAPGEMTSLLED